MKRGRKKDKDAWRRRPRRQKVTVEKTADEVDEEATGKFFGCYLLTSLSPRHKGHTYIGFTVNPKRRIRQHNGEITSGAFSTKKKRPWEMVLCIHGFPTNVAALQFEWAWQHPKESVAVREIAATFKTLGGLANKIKLALTMLTLPQWESMDLTVSFFSTQYMKHAAGSPPLPSHILLHFCSMDELPCYSHPLDDPNLLDNTHSHFSPDFDPSSPLTHTYSLQDATQHACDQPTLDSQFKDDSSSMLPIVIPETRVHHFPSHTDEFYSEDDSSSMLPIAAPETQGHHFPSLTDELYSDHFYPMSRGLFSDNQVPILKKHTQPFSQLPVDFHSSTGTSFNVYTTLSKEILPEDSAQLMKEHFQPIQCAALSVRNQSEKADLASTSEEVSAKEDFTCELITETPNKLSQPWPKASAGICLPSCAVDRDSVPVIDLLTPSPDCRIVAVTKKRRVPGDFPNVIDLTSSPVFLEL